MNTRNFTLAVSALALAATSFTANADILFTNLGTASPPPTIGGHAMTPFDQSAQAAIPDFTTGVTVIPGNPKAGSLGVSPGLDKRTVGTSWWAGNANPWGHNYTGPVFFNQSNVSTTLSLPADTHAFYVYAQPNSGGTWNITVTTNAGATSGPVPVTSYFNEGAANGFAFHSTAGETITSITISAETSANGMAIGEFGIDGGATTTCASEGYKGAQLTWCKNICENDLSGQVLDTWIHRWITRYRDLPYCAVETPSNPG